VFTRFALLALLAAVCADHLLYRQNAQTRQTECPKLRASSPKPPIAEEAQSGGLDVPPPLPPAAGISWPFAGIDSGMPTEGQIILRVRYDMTENLADAFDGDRPPCWSGIDECFHSDNWGIQDGDQDAIFYLGMARFRWPNFASKLDQPSSVVKWMPAESSWSRCSYFTIPDKSTGHLTVTITGVEMQINGRTQSGGSLQLPTARTLVPATAPAEVPQAPVIRDDERLRLGVGFIF
jgi:hypothetical protein